MHRALILFLLSLLECSAAVYYVRTDGNNGNAGTANTSGGAWQTITYAESQMTAGDTVYVQDGDYHEQPTVDISGNSGAWINFIGATTNAVCRGFQLSGASYVRIIGFGITHTNATFGGAVGFAGTCSYIEILNNYIHHVRGGNSGEGPVIGDGPATTSYITVRGNGLYWLGVVPQITFSNNAQTAFASYPVTSYRWLVEYNHVQRSGDFSSLYGTNHILRNNWMHDFDNDYWPGSYGDDQHCDMAQPGSAGMDTGARHQIYERNFMGDNIELNSHGFFFQGDDAYGDTNFLCRGNIFFNFGSGGIGVEREDKVLTYNNTFYDMTKVSTGQMLNFRLGALDCLAANTLIDNVNGSTAINAESGATLTKMFNLGHDAGSDTSFASTADPLFVNPAEGTRDFHLQAASPAIGLGTNFIFITSASASGTEFDVNDGQLLSDGKGITQGDTITVGGTTTTISAISGNTVTVADSVTWTQNDPVYWGTDTDPDIGALPYGSTNLTAALHYTNSTTHYVTVTGDTRFVCFYSNGIPWSIDYSSPYSATFNEGTITAKAYALYAQSDPVVNATDGPEPSNNRRITADRVVAGRISGGQ